MIGVGPHQMTISDVEAASREQAAGVEPRTREVAP